MARSNPYDTALTLDEWRTAQAASSRPLTDPHMHPRRAQQDARHSRLVEPIPRRTPAQRQTDYRKRNRSAA